MNTSHIRNIPVSVDHVPARGMRFDPPIRVPDSIEVTKTSSKIETYFGLILSGYLVGMLVAFTITHFFAL